MTETDYIESFYFRRKHRIHGNLSHDYSGEGGELRWYIYCIQDNPCHKQYIGSSVNIRARWATHKSTCNSENSKSSGLANHFRNGGCKNDLGREKTTLSITLIDFMDTSESSLSRAGHISGPQCSCSECNRLKRKEDMWILRMGTFYGDSALNSRDEIKSDTRCNYH